MAPVLARLLCGQQQADRSHLFYSSSYSSVRPGGLGGNDKSPTMADFISEAKICLFKNAFSHFDKQKKGVIRAKLLGSVLRYHLIREAFKIKIKQGSQLI